MPTLPGYSPGRATGYVPPASDYNNDILQQGNWTLLMLGRQTSFPASPATNDTCFRSDLGTWFRYDGAAWQQMGFASFSTSLRPASPPTNYRYIDTTDGHIYRWTGSAYAACLGRVRILDYTTGLDLFSGLALTATTYVDCSLANSFTVTDASANIEVTVDLAAIITSTTASNEFTLFVLIDGTTRYALATSIVATANSYVGIAGGTIDIGTLSVGAHTAKTQLYAVSAATGYCRTSSLAPYEHFRMQVHENHP